MAEAKHFTALKAEIESGRGRVDVDPFKSLQYEQETTRKVMKKMSKWPSKRGAVSPHQGGS